ncbi:MAG: FHA domain-containing protein [Chloroflexi bacterium]|nr:FHA domain-containing protein [Chloroflexota bacterium]
MDAGSNELLLLRLGLIAIVFAFVLVASFTLRTSLRPAGERRRREAGVAALVVQVAAGTGIAPGTRFPLAGTTLIGRSPEAGVILGDPSVSGEHALVERTRGGWRLLDLGSTNGTVVNGRPVDGNGVGLRAGDLVGVGAVTLRFQP